MDLYEEKKEESKYNATWAPVSTKLEIFDFLFFSFICCAENLVPALKTIKLLIRRSFRCLAVFRHCPCESWISIERNVRGILTEVNLYFPYVLIVGGLLRGWETESHFMLVNERTGRPLKSFVKSLGSFQLLREHNLLTVQL